MAIPIRKTLFVGLGGFGKATLRVIRRRFYEQFGFYQIPAIEYLVLDTDNDPKAMGYNSSRDSIDRNVAFEISGRNQVGEFIDLSCKRTDLEKIYQDHVRPETRDALSWFDGGLKELGTNVLENGASMVRSFGKLGFLLTLYDSNRALSETIQRKLIRLHNLTKHDKIWEELNNKFVLDEEYKRIDIFMFCSTSGGTGSGVFLDMAYFLLGLFKNRKIDPTAEKGNMTLYLYLPHIILNDQRAQATFKPPKVLSNSGLIPQNLVKAGTYAALTELERYQLSRSGMFSFDGGWQGTDFFVPDWNPYKDPKSPKKQPNTEFVGINPFDWVFLIGDRSTSRHPLKGAEDAIEMTADKMFLFLIEREQGRLIESYLANRPMFSMPKPQKSEEGTFQRQYAKTYGGFGVSKIYIGEPLIHRWAGYYLAENFLNNLLNKNEKLPAAVNKKAISIIDDFAWSCEKLFHDLADKMLIEVRDEFFSLNSKIEFCDLVKLGTYTKSEKACYGKVNEIDDVAEQKLLQLKDIDHQQHFQEIIENWLIENGIKATVQLLNSLQELINKENKIVKANISEKITLPENFTEECWRWIISHNKTLDWMGHNNQPKESKDKYPYKKLSTIISHYKEALELPEKYKRKIIDSLEDRFFEYFINNDCCKSWKYDLFNDISNLSGIVNDLETGFVLIFKQVLTKIDQIQKILINTIDEMKGIISVQHKSSAHGTLERSLLDILSREEQGHIVGISQELKDLSIGRDPKSRNVYCGEKYQKPESLKNHTPDIEFIAETFKEGFGKYQKDGTYIPIKHLWDVVNASSLENGTKQWINILIDRKATELKIKPTLNDYYDSLKNFKQVQFKDDIKHCLDTCASYLRYESKNFGENIDTNSNQLVFSPGNILKEVKDVIEEINSNLEVNQYGGEELLFITIEDGVIMPMLEMMEDYKEAYKDFDWPKAVWTRGGNPQEIFYASDDSYVEFEIFLGIILGNIWFDKNVKSYKMIVERVGMEGAEQSAPIGSSIREVKDFFYGPKSKNYINPFERLMDINEKTMGQLVVLRKFEPLLQYYEKYYFKDSINEKDERKPPHLHLIYSFKKLRERKLKEDYSHEKFIKTNQESLKLNKWLHAFCDIVPIMETPDLRKPNREWIPVLMTGFQPEIAKRTLIWHNTTFSPDNTQKHSEHKPLFEYAMDATLGEDSKGNELKNWNEKNPENIPKEIMELAWIMETDDKSEDDPTDSVDGKLDII